MKSDIHLRRVINKLNEIDFNNSKDKRVFGKIYETFLSGLQSAGTVGGFYAPRVTTGLAGQQSRSLGCSYAPSDTLWWNHGYSTETDFIYITTQNLSVEKLQQLSDEVGGDKTLLVCRGSFRCKPDRFANLTIKKIPEMVLSRCEWAHDDYV